jgi:hypothetical protein
LFVFAYQTSNTMEALRAVVTAEPDEDEPDEDEPDEEPQSPLDYAQR